MATNRAFERLQPGEAVPPPPVELTEWAQNTAFATLAGMLYGGSRAHIVRELPSADVNPQARRTRTSERAFVSRMLPGNTSA